MTVYFNEQLYSMEFKKFLLFLQKYLNLIPSDLAEITLDFSLPRDFQYLIVCDLLPWSNF